MYGRVVLLFIVAALPQPVSADDGIQPSVVAEPARVAIDVLPAGRRLIRLPSLEFRLRIEPRCDPELQIQSVSISVADTHKTYDAADFAETSMLETTLRLPGRQIGPLAVDAFCESPSGPASTRVAEALSANVSLRCANDSRQAVNYENLALDVLLTCSANEPVEPRLDRETENGQESPSSTTRF